MVYLDLTDNSLQSLAVSGDREAEEALCERYMRLVRMCARPLFLAGGSGEDLIQEGMIGLLSAIRTTAAPSITSQSIVSANAYSQLSSPHPEKSISLSTTVFLSSNSRKILIRSYRQLQRFSGTIRRIWFWPERARKNFTTPFPAACPKWKTGS